MSRQKTYGNKPYLTKKFMGAFTVSSRFRRIREMDGRAGWLISRGHLQQSKNGGDGKFGQRGSRSRLIFSTWGASIATLEFPKLVCPPSTSTSFPPRLGTRAFGGSPAFSGTSSTTEWNCRIPETFPKVGQRVGRNQRASLIKALKEGDTLVEFQWHFDTLP